MFVLRGISPTQYFSLFNKKIVSRFGPGNRSKKLTQG